MASSDESRWELIIKSKRLTMWAWIGAAIVMAVHIFMGIVVNVGNTGATVTFLDQLAFPFIGLLISAVILLLTRARVRVNDEGVEVRNMLNPRFYAWSDIYGLSFPRSARWARLELPDFEFVPMLALQSADAERTVHSVQAFRKLEEKYMPED